MHVPITQIHQLASHGPYDVSFYVLYVCLKMAACFLHIFESLSFDC